MSESGDGTIAFRRMREDDLGLLVRWRHEPHVLRWFRDPPSNVEDAMDRYGDRLHGDHPTRMWVVEEDGEPVAQVQDFPIDAEDELAVRVQLPGAVGFDYLIGDPDRIGRGLGTRMIAQYLRQVVRRDHPDAPWLVACPDARNAASLRVLDKLGFTQRQWIQVPGEEYAQIVCRIAADDAPTVSYP
ncbi:GNAT family N-acetyltransferase [Mumia qirimensis]|uniref:GNAT family N-acetyltransferase n=1 Tax=Mumia qirimensis TaxID=3234852 RepID=UPI00351D4B3A